MNLTQATTYCFEMKPLDWVGLVALIMFIWFVVWFYFMELNSKRKKNK